jgi:peptidoglycan/LPS O-acetylase OafA/YrhL
LPIGDGTPGKELGNSFLASPPLIRLLGDASYSIYLFH